MKGKKKGLESELKRIVKSKLETYLEINKQYLIRIQPQLFEKIKLKSNRNSLNQKRTAIFILRVIIKYGLKNRTVFDSHR